MTKVRSCTDRRADAAIYRAAAKLLEDGESRWACFAIKRASKRRLGCKAFRAVFGPSRDNSVHRLEGWWGNSYFKPDAEGPRILALCFMAAMVEAGDA